MNDQAPNTNAPPEPIAELANDKASFPESGARQPTPHARRDEDPASYSLFRPGLAGR